MAEVLHLTHHWEKKRKEKLCMQINSPYINQGKGDTLAEKSRDSPPPQDSKPLKSPNLVQWVVRNEVRWLKSRVHAAAD
eukprot:1136288-Pelagomonas_calceolata.AAC.3